MFIRYKSILIIIAVPLVSPIKEVKELRKKSNTTSNPTSSPTGSGVDENVTSSCEEFVSRTGFNPHSVLGDRWFSFFMWAPQVTRIEVSFMIPTNKERTWMKYHFKDTVEKPINWSKTTFLMYDHIANTTVVFVETDKRGKFNLYNIVKLPEDEKLETTVVAWKQTSDNRYIAVMFCEEDMVYVFSRIHDVPKQKHIQDAADTIGYRGRLGRSYLYEGNHWMPIPDLGEEEYWNPKEPEKLPDEPLVATKYPIPNGDVDPKQLLKRHFVPV